MENKQTSYHALEKGIFWKSVSGIFGFLVGSTINQKIISRISELSTVS